MKKLLSITLTLLLVVAMIAGCGKKQEAETSGGANDAESGKTVGEKSEKPKDIQLKIAFYADEASTEIMYQIFDKYMDENPHVKINEVASSWEGHYEKLKTGLAGGAGPDIFLLDGPYIPTYADRNSITNITAFAKELDLDKYFGFDVIESPEGKIYGIPQGMQIHALYYNKDMFDAANVDYPTSDWTFDDMFSAAKKLTNDDAFGMCLPNHIRAGWYTMIRAYGGDCLDETRTQSTIKSDPVVKQVVKMIYDAWHVDHSTPNMDDMMGELGDNVFSFFPRQKVAMFINNYASVVKSNAEGFNYDVQQVPQGKKGVRYNPFVANCWVINENAKDEAKEEALRFFKYYLSDEVQRIQAKTGESLPANKAIVKELIGNNTNKPENKKAFLEGLEFAGDLGENAVWEEWFVKFNNLNEQYLFDELTLDEFIDTADKEVQKILDNYYKK